MSSSASITIIITIITIIITIITIITTITIIESSVSIHRTLCVVQELSLTRDTLQGITESVAAIALHLTID